jgi:phosphoglycolate phosphatase
MYLIFDFDGTLVDSFAYVIKQYSLLAIEHDLKKITASDIENLRNLDAKDIIKFLQIPLYKIPRLILQIRKKMSLEMPTLAPVQNMPNVLHDLKAAGFSLGILTSNSAENVSLWLQHNQLQHLFNFIYIESTYMGKQKILKKILNNYQIERSKAFYIGDETRDIEAANGCGIHSIAVTWGYNSEKILTQSQPKHILHQPADLLSLFGLS